MSVVKELLRAESDGTVSFGDYTLEKKAKLPDFEHKGDIYYVKTYAESTRLEKNGMFVYESVPGTAVTAFQVREDGVSFCVDGAQDAQVTLELAEETGLDFSQDTYDGGLHLNLTGAEKITKYLGKVLAEECALPDRRGEAELSEAWEEKISAYEQEIEEQKRMTGQWKEIE